MLKINLQKKEIIKWGIIAGILQGVYCMLVGLLFLFMAVVASEPINNFLTGVAMFLLFFVFSAAISGLIVLGYPTVLALNKKYKEALKMLMVTLITILALFFLFILINVIF